MLCCMNPSIILLKDYSRFIHWLEAILKTFQIGISCKSFSRSILISLHDDQLWVSTKPDRTLDYLYNILLIILQVYKIIPILLIGEAPDKLDIMIRLSLDRAFIKKDNILPVCITSPILHKLTSFFSIFLSKINALLALLFL